MYMCFFGVCACVCMCVLVMCVCMYVCMYVYLFSSKQTSFTYPGNHSTCKTMTILCTQHASMYFKSHSVIASGLHVDL